MDPVTAFILVAVLYLLYRMGCTSSSPSSPSSSAAAGGGKSGDVRRGPKANAILDNYRSLAEVEMALRKAGLESSDLIIAIDFTKSNTWQGQHSFGRQNLHTLSPAGLTHPNPYQSVVATLADVLVKKLDDDCSVPMYGFGDVHTGNRAVFMLNNEQPCQSKEEMLCAYADAAAHVTLSGPTSFAPIIYEAIDVCRSTGKYHILVIIADGLMDDTHETIKAIEAASNHPLSIVMVGVGDGPWDDMEQFDDEIPARAFDNFQFVNFTEVATRHPDPDQRAMRFALDALMELPEQYQYIKSHGMLSRGPSAAVRFPNRLTGKHHFPRSFIPSVAPGDVQIEGAGLSASYAPGGANPPPYSASSLEHRKQAASTAAAAAGQSRY